MKMKLHEKNLGHNPFSVISELGYDVKWKRARSSPLGSASYLDLDMVLSEQGSGRCILSDVIHHRLGVGKNEQESLYLTRWM
jgi:hypothetical protein